MKRLIEARHPVLLIDAFQTGNAVAPDRFFVPGIQRAGGLVAARRLAAN